ncbi:hypothetical protein [Clostridium uliginosum]|uniref:Energy-coupling factor transport system substrate-specific component n=1 Tax=Clostridium uliginosum TaxID=119641 RepID=A0A1I1RSY8_9CLOT|nr:hypothetical protein [Clostridium uliginosum]SFD37167.1 hypothetical protein SAMN05421842_1385 [Clostridium uliginosum]
MKSNNIAQGGIVIALTLIILYSASILPVSTLTVLTIASCLIPICIIRTSVKNALLVYISSTILSFFLVKIDIAIYYGLFFGIYGIIKCLIEKLNKFAIEIILKLISFNFLLGIGYFLISSFLGINELKLPIYLLFIIAQVVFLIFDYALTLIITFYLNKIHKAS